MIAEMTPETPAGRLVPDWTLARALGPGVVWVARHSPTVRGLFPNDPGRSDFMSGNQIPLAGGAPLVACVAAMTPDVLAVLRDAGVPTEAELHPYRTVSEYPEVLRRLIAAGFRISSQRRHPESEIPASASLAPPSLVSDLNDKGRMDRWVPPEWLPPRRVMNLEELPGAEGLLSGGPVVLKASTPISCGGGYGVWICREHADVERARAALAGQPRVVAEKHLRLRRTVCVHAVIAPGGAVHLAGTAEEIVDAAGHWQGNWLDAEGDRVPAAVLDAVRGVMEKASAAGYRGLAGIDVAFPEDGPPLLLDLNFRINGSAAAAWFRGSLERTRGARVIRCRGFSFDGGFREFLDRLRPAIDGGSLVPLGLYDPSAWEMGGLARANVLLVGPSRESIREEERRLLSTGLR